MNPINLLHLPPWDEATKCLNVVVETPKGSRNKYNYDGALGLFRLKKMLPAGAVFPFDFGFVPQTLAEDGDPLDVLFLMDEAAFPGCVVEAHLIGAIEANQTKRGRTIRNDRLIAIAGDNSIHCKVTTIGELNETLLHQIEHFFISYNEAEGKKFVPIRRARRDEAVKLIAAAHERYLANLETPEGASRKH